jgi:hypothetical protein
MLRLFVSLNVERILKTSCNTNFILATLTVLRGPILYTFYREPIFFPTTFLYLAGLKKERKKEGKKERKRMKEGKDGDKA